MYLSNYSQSQFIQVVLIGDSLVELVEEVVTATFQYLAMLRNMEPQEWVFQELSLIHI